MVQVHRQVAGPERNIVCMGRLTSRRKNLITICGRFAGPSAGAFEGRWGKWIDMVRTTLVATTRLLPSMIQGNRLPETGWWDHRFCSRKPTERFILGRPIGRIGLGNIIFWLDGDSHEMEVFRSSRGLVSAFVIEWIVPVLVSV